MQYTKQKLNISEQNYKLNHRLIYKTSTFYPYFPVISESSIKALTVNPDIKLFLAAVLKATIRIYQSQLMSSYITCAKFIGPVPGQRWNNLKYKVHWTSSGSKVKLFEPMMAVYYQWVANIIFQIFQRSTQCVFCCEKQVWQQILFETV